jgi:hypothetical protein
MANLGETFNADDHEEPISFDPLPPGEYVAQVVDSEIKDTKAGDGKYVKLQWQVIDGEYTNRIVFANYNIINPSEKAQEIGEREFAAACRGLGKSHVSDTEELHAIPCVIKLKIDPGKNGYGPSNRITAYKPAVMAQQQPAPVQQQAAPAQQAAQPAPAAGKPVWQVNG